MGTLAPMIKFREFDDNGSPLSGGKLYSYKAGTSTPLTTYQDADQLTPNTNPVILDADGRADVRLGGSSYKFLLRDSNDNLIWEVDDVSSEATTSSSSGWSEQGITDGQSATNVIGETIDFDEYSSAIYDCEITRGTTVIATGRFSIQNLNGTGRVEMGTFMTNEFHGVTFSVSNPSSTIWQLQVAADTGAGNGSIKLRRILVPA